MVSLQLSAKLFHIISRQIHDALSNTLYTVNENALKLGKILKCKFSYSIIISHFLLRTCKRGRVQFSGRHSNDVLLYVIWQGLGLVSEKGFQG